MKSFKERNKILDNKKRTDIKRFFLIFNVDTQKDKSDRKMYVFY